MHKKVQPGDLGLSRLHGVTPPPSGGESIGLRMRSCRSRQGRCSVTMGRRCGSGPGRSTFVAVNVESGADRAGLPEADGVRGLRLPSRHGRKAYLLGSSGDCRSGSVWKVPAHRLMLPPNAWGGSLVAVSDCSLPDLREPGTAAGTCGPRYRREEAMPGYLIWLGVAL